MLESRPIKLDALTGGGMDGAAGLAAQVEAAGYEGIISPEVAHDPFLPLALAAASTQRIDLITGIAVAFARSPMTVAVAASDLQRFSGGRFILGLGSQVKPHITRRFSMPWSRPAARMREFVLALRSIWQCWEDGSPLAFEGDFYQHNLMTPMFSHGPSEVGPPRVFIAAVGPAMTAVAGEVADGLMAHGFTTPSYLREVTLPTLAEGLAKSGRERAQIEVTLPVIVSVAVDGQDLASQRRGVRLQLGFYGSTPSYRPVLDHHGWGDLGDELHALSKAGEWDRMADVVPDEVVDAFAVVADSATDAGAMIAERYVGLVDRLQLGFDPARGDDAATIAAAVRSA